MKLIAEPWDVGPGGYNVGQFPVRWSEWNGKFRDCVRRFWKGDIVHDELGWRLSGSADLYQAAGRKIFARLASRWQATCPAWARTCTTIPL